MNKTVLLSALGLVLVCSNTVAVADEWVNGYTRSDGTYVEGHYRSSPNSTVTDNYSFKGNTNPYTGETGSNHYRDDPSSPYYDGGSSLGSDSLGSGTGLGSDYGSGFDSDLGSDFDTDMGDPW